MYRNPLSQARDIIVRKKPKNALKQAIFKGVGADCIQIRVICHTWTLILIQSESFFFCTPPCSKPLDTEGFATFYTRL